jgi:hypothetical protein
MNHNLYHGRHFYIVFINDEGVKCFLVTSVYTLCDSSCLNYKFTSDPINSSQVKFIRSLTGVRNKNEDFRSRWRVYVMVQEVQNYQFKWMQHVLRTPANRLRRKLLKYEPHGRRDLGRPHRRCTDY